MPQKLDQVYDAITDLKEGQAEMGFAQTEIAKDVKALADHARTQNGHITELQTKEVQRAERERIEEKSNDKQLGNVKWVFGLAIPASLAAIIAVAEGIRAL